MPFDPHAPVTIDRPGLIRGCLDALYPFESPHTWIRLEGVSDASQRTVEVALRGAGIPLATEHGPRGDPRRRLRAEVEAAYQSLRVRRIRHLLDTCFVELHGRPMAEAEPLADLVDAWFRVYGRKRGAMSPLVEVACAYGVTGPDRSGHPRQLTRTQIQGALRRAWKSGRPPRRAGERAPSAPRPPDPEPAPTESLGVPKIPRRGSRKAVLRLLGLGPRYSHGELRAARRSLLLRYHPDHHARADVARLAELTAFIQTFNQIYEGLEQRAK